MPPRNQPPLEAVVMYHRLTKSGTAKKAAADEVARAFPNRFNGLMRDSVYRALADASHQYGGADGLCRIMEDLPEPVDITPLLAPLEVPYADSLVICDAHLPHHDRELMARALHVAKRWKIGRCILAGDTMDFDCFSSYLKVSSENPVTIYQQVAQLLVALSKQFAEILVIMGNHDERVGRRLDLKEGLGYLLAKAKDHISAPDLARVNRVLRYTERFYLVMHGTPDGVCWRISHPDNYRKNRLSVAMEGCLKYQCHFLSAHQHHLGATISTYGAFWAVDGGCLVDSTKTEYIQRRDKMSADWAPGFILLKHGEPHVARKGAPEAWWQSL